MNVYEELSQTGIQLLLREPFYAHLLSSVSKQVVGKGHEVDTMAVGPGPRQSITLFVNEDFWHKDLKNPLHRMGILKHEMLHLVFKHLQVQAPELDAKLLNIAFDLVVNQYIDKTHLLPDSIFLDTFPEMRFEADQTWFYYYEKLAKAKRGEHDSWMPAPEQTQNALSEISEASNGLERHQPWQEIQDRSQLENSVMENHLDSLLRNAMQRTAAHQWGNLPGQVRAFLDQLNTRNQADLDWKNVLRLFVGSTGKTRVKNTVQRPSKRYGTTPGLKIKRLQRLFVAVDTSGSIGREDLDLFFKEIFHIWRSGVSIEILECDTRVSNRYPYKGITPDQVQGRGGTIFEEPLQLANRDRPDGLIYFTDGFAATPQTKPNLPVLWVITRRGLSSSSPDFQRLPGRKVQIG